jgi:hypothetical protein
MAIGTSINLNTPENFEFLNNLDTKQQLKILVELGYFDIKSRSNFAAGYISENVNNPYFPNPGGKQGESFVKNTELKKVKSRKLNVITNGLMPPHVEISGAPYSTFVEGTILPGETHPFYDLIVGPTHPFPAPIISDGNNTSLDYLFRNPEILDQFFNAVSNVTTQAFNKLGTPFVPGTTKTSYAVKAKKDNKNIEALPTYNIWQVDNLPGAVDGNKLINFSFENYLGFLPKTTVDTKDIQPYAQTWSFTDMAQIQVYASNSQVSMTRIYPMFYDYTWNSKAKYLIYNNATLDKQLEDVSIGFSTTINKPVGFSIRFSSVVLSNNPPTQASTNAAVLSESRLIISWGYLPNSPITTQADCDNLVSNDKVFLYTLEISPNDSPRLFFNLSNLNMQNINAAANYKSVELNNLKRITSPNKNSGDKTPNDYELYVFYSGQYLYIGNEKDPSSWQVIKKPTIPLSNEPGNAFATKTFEHYLDEKSYVNIQAQYMNFTFCYGPPLFDPHDDQNIPALGADKLANTLNFAQFNTPYDNKSSIPTKEQVLKSLKENTALTFENTNPNQQIGGATVYHDIRTGPVENLYDVLIEDLNKDSTKGTYATKITFPKTLGGDVFNKYTPSIDIPEPDILENYVKYDLTTKDGVSNISQILTETVSNVSVTKSLEQGTSNYVKSTLSITFQNLNESEAGLKILQFMRHNVCVLRVSAGYDTLYPYFEGMVFKITANESLDKTEIIVEAHDLIDSLFERDKTLIVSKVAMHFPGMRLKKIINSLVYFSELHNHFKYDLGDVTNENTIAYYLENNPEAGLPRIADALPIPNLGKFFVSPYSAQNTYFKVLKQCRDLLIQVNINKDDRKRFDVPVYYWFTSGVEGLNNRGRFGISTDVNGIVMSSRTLPKDKDTFFLRKKSIKQIMLDDVNELHGYLSAENAFTSSSNADNLFYRGLFRFLDIDTEFQLVQEVFPNAISPFQTIEDANQYIGYEKIVMFDDPDSDPDTQTTIAGIHLPDRKLAENFVKKWMNANYNIVYESINLSAYVTKPLNEWGWFTVCIENELQKNPKVEVINDVSFESTEIPEQFLYSNITYKFKLDENLIIAEINGSKSPIQNI